MPLRSPLMQLQRYLIEIVAYSLEADFKSVRRALDQDESGSISTAKGEEEVNSILTDSEKQELFRLAKIILDLYHKHKRNQGNLTLDCDRAAILTAIVEPTYPWDTFGDYVVDMISTYAEYVTHVHISSLFGHSLLI